MNRQMWKGLQKTLQGSGRGKLALLAALMLLSALLEAGAAALLLPLMSALTDAATLGDSAVSRWVCAMFGCHTQAAFLSAMAAVNGGAYVVKGLVSLAASRLMARYTADCRRSVSARLFGAYLRLPYDAHTRLNTADMVRSVTLDTENYGYLLASLLTLLFETLVAVCLVGMLALVNPALTLVVAALTLASLALANGLVAKQIQRAGTRAQQQDTLVIRWVTQTARTLKCIKATGRERYFYQRYLAGAEAGAEARCRYLTLQALPRMMIETAGIAGIFLFISLAAANDGGVSRLLPVFSVFALAAVRLMPAANRISVQYNQVVFFSPALEKINQALAEYKGVASPGLAGPDWEPTAPPEAGKGPVAAPPLRQGVCVRDLCFAYAGSPAPVLRNVNLFIPAGGSTALTGETGAGKTTLADIILGLYRPQSGTVTADGRNVHENGTWWAARVGYVPQEIFLLDDTLRANVAFGEERIDDQRVRRCLESARMADFVDGLPQGTDTLLGENGMRLSGGQKQRLGVARALYGDPQFIVLDEATSALDRDTEKALVDAIQSLAGDKTLLVIAHSPAAMAYCHTVYEIRNGTAEKCKG